MASLQSILAVTTGAVGVFYLREYMKGGQCQSKARLDGKTVVVSGANTGIGKETALDLSRRGAKVVMACRNLDLANKTAAEIRANTNGSVAVYHLDLASLSSVRACAEEIQAKEDHVHVLINNAGVMMCDYGKTEDGFEMQIGTNHFGHFLFTHLLLDKLKASAPARIVNVSSRAHRGGTIDLEDMNFEKRPYSRIKAYSQSKLANVLFTKELARRLEGSGVTCYSLHPGVVMTELFRHIEEKVGPLKYLAYPLALVFMKTAADGAQTTIYCAVEETLAKESGKYYADCKETEPQPLANDQELAKQLWSLSEKAVKI